MELPIKIPLLQSSSWKGLRNLDSPTPFHMRPLRMCHRSLMLSWVLILMGRLALLGKDGVCGIPSRIPFHLCQLAFI